MYPRDNIFNIYYNIGKRTPFLVKRCELGLARSSSEERRIDPNQDRTFLVEKVNHQRLSAMRILALLARGFL